MDPIKPSSADSVSVVASLAYAGVGTFVLLRLVAAFTPLRVTAAQELTGIDLHAHSEQGYRDSEAGLGAPVFLAGD